MRNLFIVHTQYNLILATGLSMTEYQEDENDLILFTDFYLNSKLDRILMNSYKRYMKLEGTVYPKREVSIKGKFYKIKNDNKKIKQFINKAYDRLFVVYSGNIQEEYAMKCAYKKNRQIDLAWLEDGGAAYFDNRTPGIGGMGSTFFKRFVRKISFTSLYGLGKFYDLPERLGTHRMLKKAYLIYPDIAKIEYKDLEHIGISQQAFSSGVNMLYGEEAYPFEHDSVLIVLDKLDIYGELKESVSELITKELQMAEKRGIKVYYKYHPCETERLSVLENATELDRNIALEGYLSNSQDKCLKIVGLKSTALQMAKKMGYNTVSLIKHLEPENNEVIQFYEDIGIVCPE